VAALAVGDLQEEGAVIDKVIAVCAALGWFGALGLAMVFVAGGAVGYLIRRWDDD
jgi:hypothetical protein